MPKKARSPEESQAHCPEIMERLRIPQTLRITDPCIGCTACAKICPVLAISGNKGSLHQIDGRRCVGCQVCAWVCPAGAITDLSAQPVPKLSRFLWPKPQIDEEACTACSICVTLCTPGALRIQFPKEKGDIRVAAELFDAKKCIGCRICAENCPIEAITMSPPEVTP